MSTQETVPLWGTAEVHGLEARRTTAEVYAAFYNLYAEAYQDGDGVSSSLLMSPRIIHVDETGDRSQHIVVRQKDSDGLVRPMSRVFYSKTYQLNVPYWPEHFIVATTDGETINQWTVETAHGIYEGRIVQPLHPYDPENETIRLELVKDGVRNKLTFNAATGLGRFGMGNQNAGWILSDVESAHERHRIVPPTEEQVARVGHLAIVS
jgi:hypothetical protein